MPTWLWITLGVLVVLVTLWRVLAPTLDRAVERAIKAQDADLLVTVVRQMGPGAQPDAFNHVIRRLWDAYQRPLTVPLIRALAEHHAESQIAQYWLDQIQGVEPELARQAFDRGFLDAHYKPQVAATCGEAG